MPYIKQEQREIVDNDIEEIAKHIARLQLDDPEINIEGVMNYIITKLIYRVYSTPSYREINDVMGMLECVKQEYYRKQAAPYEDQKEVQNGPVTN